MYYSGRSGCSWTLFGDARVNSNTSQFSQGCLNAKIQNRHLTLWTSEKSSETFWWVFQSTDETGLVWYGLWRKRIFPSPLWQCFLLASRYSGFIAFCLSRESIRFPFPILVLEPRLLKKELRTVFLAEATAQWPTGTRWYAVRRGEKHISYRSHFLTVRWHISYNFKSGYNISYQT